MIVSKERDYGTSVSVAIKASGTSADPTLHVAPETVPGLLVRVIQAERKAVEDGLAFQRRATPDPLRHDQTFRDVLTAFQQIIQTDSWQQLANSITHLTRMGSVGHLINNIVKKERLYCSLP